MTQARHIYTTHRIVGHTQQLYASMVTLRYLSKYKTFGKHKARVVAVLNKAAL